MSDYTPDQIECIKNWQIAREINKIGTKVVVPNDIDLVYIKDDVNNRLTLYCTETNGIYDILKDINILPSYYRGSIYSRGFMISTRALYNKLIDDGVLKKGMRVKIYGYSLGGAIAQILGDMIQDLNEGTRPDVIGFGVPNTIIPLFNWKRIKSRKSDIVYEQGFGLISNLPLFFLSFAKNIRLPKYGKGRMIQDNHNFYWMSDIDV